MRLTSKTFRDFPSLKIAFYMPHFADRATLKWKARERPSPKKSYREQPWTDSFLAVQLSPIQHSWFKSLTWRWRRTKGLKACGRYRLGRFCVGVCRKLQVKNWTWSFHERHFFAFICLNIVGNSQFHHPQSLLRCASENQKLFLCMYCKYRPAPCNV